MAEHHVRLQHGRLVVSEQNMRDHTGSEGEIMGRLAKSAADFERPPPVQSQANIRAINAMDEARVLIAAQASEIERMRGVPAALEAIAQEAWSLAVDFHNRPAAEHFVDPSLNRLAYAMGAKCDHFLEAANIVRASINSTEPK